MESRFVSWPEIYGFTIGGGFPVVVVKVKEGSVAQKAGLLPGDQILGLDDNDVRSFSKEDVIACAKRSRQVPPPMSVISRIRCITLLNEGLSNYGLIFKGNGPVYVYTVEKNTAAFHLDVQPGDILVELNGIRVNGYSKEFVEKLLKESHVKATLLLIAGAVNISKTREHEQPEKRKQSTLHEMVDYCLIGEEKKKDQLAHLLHNYTISRNINELVNGLNLLLTNPIERQLIPFIRLLLSTYDRRRFDKVFTASHRKRMVCVSRQSDDQPFGILLFDQSPVVVHSVVEGSVADRFGIKSGDVFLEINGIDIRKFGYEDVTNLLYSSGLQTNICFLRQEMWQEPKMQSTSTEFKQQMKMRLTRGEQIVLKQALVGYLFNQNLTDLFRVLKTLLDEPYKMQLLHYLYSFLPKESHALFERNAKEMLAYHSERKKGSAVVNKEHKLISEHELTEIQKGSTLDILLSLDDEVLDDIKVKQMKKEDQKHLIETKAIVHSPRQKKAYDKKHGKVDDKTSVTERFVTSSNDRLDKEYFIKRFPIGNGEKDGLQVTNADCENVRTPEDYIEGTVSKHSKVVRSNNINHSSSKSLSTSPISTTQVFSPPHSAEVSLTSQLIESSQAFSTGITTKGALEDLPQALSTHSTSLPLKASSQVPSATPPPPPTPPPAPPPPPLADLSQLTAVFSPPPPPPPPLPSDHNKMRLSGKSMRLKRLNWEKLRKADLKNTVWNEMGDGSISNMINFEELEELFSKSNAKVLGKQNTPKKCGSILSAKKAHSIDILFAYLKLPVERIRDFLLEVDGSLLSKENLKVLLNALPDDKETSALSRSDSSSLTFADSFTKQMLLIPDYGKRLQVMVFRSEFHEKVQGIRMDVNSVCQACKQLRNSDNLKQILELVLATGNYMNKSYNSIAGAGGFKISLLPKLVSMKTSDNDSTLLHVIVKSLLAKKREVLDINQELDCVPAAAKVSIQMIKEEVAEVKKGMKDINEVLKSPTTRQDANKDKFANVMSQFVNEAHHSFHELLTQYTQMQCDFQKLVQFFGDDYTKATTEDFFGSFAVFLQHIQTTKDTLLKSQQKDLHTNRALRQRLSVSAVVESKNIIKADQRRASLPVCSLTAQKEAVDENQTREMNYSTLNEIAEKLSSIPKKGTLSAINKDSPPLVVDAWKVAVEIKPDKSKSLSQSPKPWVSPSNSPSQGRKVISSSKEIIDSLKNDSECSATALEEEALSPTEYCASNNKSTDVDEVMSKPLPSENTKVHETKESSSTPGKMQSDVTHTSKNSADNGKEISDEVSAYNDVIRASRSPQSAPKFLNLVKAKLVEERKKNERPKLRRKITKHEQPLYARVMKETLNEYELRRKASAKRKEKESTGSPSTKRRIESPNFISIMEEKLKENVPEVSESFDVSSRKKSVSEPLYASAIRETLQDYQHKKDERQRMQENQSKEIAQESLGDGYGRSTPNFLSMLHDNLVGKNLIFEDEESDVNSALTEDDPLYAMVIKAAITQNRQSSERSSDEKLPSPIESISPTPSLLNSNDHSSKSPYDGDHSCSSSDISLTSEEVNQINGRFFKTASKQTIEPTAAGKFLKNGTKPALPSIPSPDYAAQNRPISDGSADVHGGDSSDSSSSKKGPRRSSLRKKESVSKQNNVCFVKKVEVISETVEESDEQLASFPTESSLKGSPNVVKKNVLTTDMSPTNVQDVVDGSTATQTIDNIKTATCEMKEPAPDCNFQERSSPSTTVHGPNEYAFQEGKVNSSPEPPTINRSSKPKKNTANLISTDIRHGHTALLRTIIPSPDYSPDFSPDNSPISARKFTGSPNRSTTTVIEKNAVGLNVMNMVETPNPSFVAPIQKNLIHVYEEEYIVQTPHVSLVKTEDSSLRRISPLNWNQPKSDSTSEPPPPIIDRAKKPVKKRDQPPELLPRSPQTVMR